MSEPIHYNPDPFGLPLCGRLGVEDATRPYTVHCEPPSVTCDLCLLAAFPWLDEYVNKRIAESTIRPAAPSEEPVKHWCLKTNGDTCPMPCANGCDDERSDA